MTGRRRGKDFVLDNNSVKFRLSKLQQLHRINGYKSFMQSPLAQKQPDNRFVMITWHPFHETHYTAGGGMKQSSRCHVRTWSCIQAMVLVFMFENGVLPSCINGDCFGIVFAQRITQIVNNTDFTRDKITRVVVGTRRMAKSLSFQPTSFRWVCTKFCFEWFKVRAVPYRLPAGVQHLPVHQLAYCRSTHKRNMVSIPHSFIPH